MLLLGRESKKYQLNTKPPEKTIFHSFVGASFLVWSRPSGYQGNVTYTVQGGPHSTEVAFALPTQPSRVRIFWPLENNRTHLSLRTCVSEICSVLAQPEREYKKCLKMGLKSWSYFSDRRRYKMYFSVFHLLFSFLFTGASAHWSYKGKHGNLNFSHLTESLFSSLIFFCSHTMHLH